VIVRTPSEGIDAGAAARAASETGVGSFGAAAVVTRSKSILLVSTQLTAPFTSTKPKVPVYLDEAEGAVYLDEAEGEVGA